MALLKVICSAYIFIVRNHFPPGYETVSQLAVIVMLMFEWMSQRRNNIMGERNVLNIGVRGSGQLPLQFWHKLTFSGNLRGKVKFVFFTAEFCGKCMAQNAGNGILGVKILNFPGCPYPCTTLQPIFFEENTFRPLKNFLLINYTINEVNPDGESEIC